MLVLCGPSKVGIRLFGEIIDLYSTFLPAKYELDFIFEGEFLLGVFYSLLSGVFKLSKGYNRIQQSI